MALNPALCALALAGGLAAQEIPPPPNQATSSQTWDRPSASSDPEAPRTTVALGAYSQAVSNHYGHWQGMLFDTSWNPWKDGKFVGSIISSDRPEGSGLVGSLGKYQEFKGGYGFLGLATSRGADYLPTIQLIGDLNLELPLPGLVLGGGSVYSRIRDHHENLLASIGPTLYAGDFIGTARVFFNRSRPGNHDSTSTTIQVRHGAQDHRPWQSLRFSWGGEAYQNLIVREAVQARGAGAALDCFFPLSGGWTLQTGAEWGQKNGAYHLWGGSLRIGRAFH